MQRGAGDGAYGFFGKLPAHGDFIRRGLPQGFVDPWDRWMQERMLAARSAAGETWDGLYLHAPIWRFTLSAGVCGAAPALGVLMASVDRVGRQFPLTLAAQAPGGQGAAALHLAAREAHHSLEEIALDALEDGADRESLEAALERAPPPPAAPAQTGGALSHRASPERAFAGIADEWLRAKLAAPCVFSSLVGEEERCFFSDGLPGAAAFAAMIDPAASFWGEGAAA